MGKFRSLGNRLSSGNGRFDESRLEFNTKDARLKLNIQKAKIQDARDILNKNKPKRFDDLQRSIKNDMILVTHDDKQKTKEPVVIVTGLGNVRRTGDKVHVLKRNDSNGKLAHQVVSDGLNTFVTLTNDLALKKNNDYDIFHDDNYSKKNSSNKNYEPIRIKISNNNYDSNDNTTSNAMPHLTNSFSFNNTNNRNNNSLQMGESMEFESSIYDNNKSLFSRTNSIASTSSNMFTNLVDNSSFKLSSKQQSDNYDFSRGSASYNKEGYKLVVSNLHPRVTEDDVLELFSDVGPIKRARFLDKGLAEVVYVRIEHAKEAINKYDQKELDGRQMIINFADKSYSKDVLKDKIKKSSSPPHSSILPNTFETRKFSSQSFKFNNQSNTRNDYQDESSSMNTVLSFKSSGKDVLSNKFKMLTGNKDSASIQLPDSKKHDISNKVAIDNTIIHQVLFNKKSNINASPVTFTVKL